MFGGFFYNFLWRVSIRKKKMFVLPVPRISQEAVRRDGPEAVNGGEGGDERAGSNVLQV